MKKNIAIVISVLAIAIICIASALKPNVSIERNDEVVASAVCGVGYFANHTVTRSEFQTLLRLSAEECSDEAGTETTHLNEDGELKHAVIIGDSDTVHTKGSVYDTCVINWELTPVAAFKAFEQVCINRQFKD